MSRKLLPILPFLLLVLLWQVSSTLNGGRLLPSPTDTAVALVHLLGERTTWLDILRTLLRGTLGLLLAFLVAEVLGICGGRNPLLRNLLSPLVTFFQGCPPIVWLSLLLVWLSLGTAVPVTVVAITAFPPLFLSIAGATATLDPKFFQVAKLYNVPKSLVCSKLILPGIEEATHTAVSYALGLAWKVTATAEFIGAENGIGGRIAQAYRQLNLPELFAWTLLIAGFGLSVERLTSAYRSRPDVPKKEVRP